ncbi:MAG: hypothetical protein ACO1TE_29030 [Prosthecobacter sp.]
MKTLLTLFLLSLTTSVTVKGAIVGPVDEYPQIKTVNGTVYTKVKVVKASPLEIRIMHEGGVASIPLSQLPAEVRANYGEANPAAEANMARERRQADSEASKQGRQQREAVHFSRVTGLSYDECLRAVEVRDWAESHAEGGLVDGVRHTKAEIDEQMARAMAVLNTRPGDAEREAQQAARDAEAIARVKAMDRAEAAAAASRPPEEKAAAVGFVPGVLEIVSAKYSLRGNQPRNVKNRLTKMITEGHITAPVSMRVSDALSDAARNQGDITGTTALLITEDIIAATTTQQTGNANVLTVVYTFNGKTHSKWVAEGEMLVLP